MGSKNLRAKPIKTPKARLSYPNLFESRQFDDSREPRYECTLIFEAGSDLEAIKKAAREVARAKFGDKDGKIPKELKLTNPFHKGSEKNQDGYPPDCTYITCRSKQRPGLVDRKLQKITDPAELYPGCYVRATIVAFAYDQKGNRGVGFGLNNLQKMGEGEPLGSWSRAEDDFEEIEEVTEESEEDEAENDFLK